MTSKASLCQALLQGRVISIRDGFLKFGITNVPREIGRSVERDGAITKNPEDTGFNVTVSRVNKTGFSRNGNPCHWTEYRLNRSEHNLPGIERMQAYVNEQLGVSKPVSEPIANVQEKLF
jgi:hypothetical protein